jgi:hypothetical protein
VKPVAFLGHSFAARDEPVVTYVKQSLRTLGFTVTTGERPQASGVAKKVRARIDACDIFVALLTHRHRIDDERWTTSPWVIEEKGYAFGRQPRRPIVLLVEKGIAAPDETGGIGGDLEYIPFDRFEVDALRDRLSAMLASLLRRPAGDSPAVRRSSSPPAAPRRRPRARR